MSSARQFDAHPDAEILNGFVENALPDAERAQVLAHLGGCGRCRQIVYLAQDAMPSLETPAGAPLAEHRAADGERAWFLRRRTAWAAGFAFATIAAFVVFVSIRHPAPTQQMAKLAPSPAPIAQASQATAPAKPALNQKAMTHLQVIAPGVLAGKAASRRQAAAGAASSSAVAAAPAPAPPPALQAQGGTVPQANVEVKVFAPSATPDLNGQISLPKSGSSTIVRATRFPGAPQAVHGEMPAAKVQAGGSGAAAPSSAAETVEVNADSVQPQAQPMTPAQVGTITPQAAAGANSLKESGLIILPSGLPMVSSAEAGHTQLAIDAVGTLFLSRDLGKNWEPIERQWTGQAVRVRLAQTMKAKNTFLPGPMDKQQSPAPAAVTIPAALFEIVNDKNAIWTSADGKTWTAR